MKSPASVAAIGRVCGFGMDSTIPGRIAPDDGGSVGRWRAGLRIDHYELVREIGSGAMGVVWSARDIDLGREVAVKLVRSGGTFPQQRARLLGEARAMARVRHLNVVDVHQVGTDEDGLFIAMELLDGGTLTEWLRAAPRSPAEVMEKYIAAGRGLAAIHRAGLVHRDFKPDNVLLGSDGVARIADFGLAIPLVGGKTDAADGQRMGRGDRSERVELPGPDGGDHSLTHNGELVGTLAFMAPEQLLGDQATALSDQFSFCVALYEAIYGLMPFVVPCGETHAAVLLSAMADGTIAPPPADRQVPRRAHEILVRGLAYLPEDRWPSMDAVVDELERCRHRRRRY